MDQTNDHDNLVRLTGAVEAMVKQMEALGKSFECDVERLTAAIERYRPMEIQIALDGDRISRLEKIVYGAIGAIGVELLGLIGVVVAWLLNAR